MKTNNFNATPHKKWNPCGLRDFHRPDRTAYGEPEIRMMLRYFRVNTLGEAVGLFMSSYDNLFMWAELLAKEVMSGLLPWSTLYICHDYFLSLKDYETCTRLKRVIRYWEYFGDNDEYCGENGQC